MIKKQNAINFHLSPLINHKDFRANLDKIKELNIKVKAMQERFFDLLEYVFQEVKKSMIVKNLILNE
jgi:hypothetical protein